jgi:hypothetical protein
MLVGVELFICRFYHFKSLLFQDFPELISDKLYAFLEGVQVFIFAECFLRPLIVVENRQQLCYQAGVSCLAQV